MKEHITETTMDEICIDELEAGREMDALVAEFMGKPFKKPGHGRCCACQVCGWGYDDCQCGYSEEIEMAWEVLEKAAADTTTWIALEQFDLKGRPRVWNAVFWDGEEKSFRATADTVSLAICRAALRTVKENDLGTSDRN